MLLGPSTAACGRAQLCQPSCSSRVPPIFKAARPCRRIRLAGARPASSVGSDTESEKQAAEGIKETMAGLDALLGIEEPPEEEPSTSEAAPSKASVSVSPEALKALMEVEAQRSENMGRTTPATKQKINDSIGRIVEQARKLQESDKDNTAGEQAMRTEFEQLLTVLTGPRGMDQDEVKKIKEAVFGPQSFWVTGTAALPGVDGGLTVRGNFRGDQAKVFEGVCKRMAELYGDKYIVRLVEELDVDSMAGISDGRPVFHIVPREVSLPPDTAGWQRGAAVLLLVLTMASAVQLGLAANVGLLPKETLAWLANPDNFSADTLPPGLENFDPLPFLQSSADVAVVSLLPQLCHEVGHAITAGIKGIKTGPAFLIPNGQLGTFGSITQLKSLARNRSDLFDFASAGLLAGGAASVALFVLGLSASTAGGADLIPVPSQLFQGSLLLGGLAKTVIGGEAMARTSVMVSPMLIGGWCGLVGTAFNMLPVGNLDGGRTMLAAYGKGTLGFTSLLSYIGLGLGLLGSSLALPFGLYILICQRESERNVQDEVSEVDGTRKGLALAMVVFALLVLVPGIPDAADPSLLGPGNFL